LRRVAKYERALEFLGARSWTWLDPSAGWVDAPDGPAVSGAAPARLRSAVEQLFARYRPDIVLTVGKDGLTGHPDHLAVASRRA
jgi:LmbE family N-acetylglucosaminyl deacetylase